MLMVSFFCGCLIQMVFHVDVYLVRIDTCSVAIELGIGDHRHVASCKPLTSDMALSVDNSVSVDNSDSVDNSVSADNSVSWDSVHFGPE